MLYQIVTGEIREGDVSRWIDKTLTPVNPFWIGKNASDVEFIVFRPVKVPSEEEMLQAVVNHCQKEIDCENCYSEREYDLRCILIRIHFFVIVRRNSLLFAYNGTIVMGRNCPRFITEYRWIAPDGSIN